MITLVEFVMLLAAGLVVVPIAVLGIEVVAALLPSPRASVTGRQASVCVLVPAHNEAAMIGATLANLITQLTGKDRLLVVADNCKDETAEIARTMGAEVIERTDSKLRGKGYALDFGVRHLSHAPPDVVLVVDADCHLGVGALDRLAHEAQAAGRPVQGLYLMRAPSGSGVKARLSEFAWVLKNRARPLGLRHMGLPCQLMGTGMAFPWSLLHSANLATGEIVEDIKLGLDLARAGHAPMFCPEALVTSEFPADASACNAQRIRWEHGHLRLILTEVRSLLWQALKHRNWHLLTMALDLAVPPLAMLVLVVVAIMFVTASAAVAGASALPLLVVLTALLMLVTTILVGWIAWGRHIVSLRELAATPIYALSKVPIYVRFWFRRQTQWVRTQRE